MTDWYSAAREADGRADEEIMAEIKYRADTGAGTPPERWVVPFPSREALVEHLASVMRDRAFPEFGAAPPPVWATDAAETIVAFYEDIAKAALTYGGADRAHRLLHSALLWIEWLEEPTMEVRAAWITAARDELRETRPMTSDTPDIGAGTPLTAEDITNLSEVVESQARLGHPMTIVPNDVLVRLLDAAWPATDPAGLDVEAAVNTLMRAGFRSVSQARSVVIPMLAAALTGERHDLDDEFLTPEQRRRLARLSVADKEPS